MIGCRSANDNQIPDIPTSDNMYFPPISGTTWEQISPTQLGWHTEAIADLKSFLTQKNTKSFMILVKGRIAMEEYFNGHNATAD